MDKGKRKIGRFLSIWVVLISILLGISAEGSWAQSPSVVSQSPADQSLNVLINTNITIQFSMTMNPASSQIYLENEYGNDVMGTVQWRTTNPLNPNDTLVFIPQNGLKPANHYYYEGNAQAVTGGGAWFSASFITKFSMADATPPTVQTVYPYNGMTGVSTGERIVIRFSEAMNPNTINSANITISGLTSSDYDVKYDFGNGDVKLKKIITPFAAGTLYTVTISTNVRDLRGNPLKNQYSWSFTTGAADTTPPTVTQTIPTNGDIKVSLFPNLYAIFSEEMHESTFNTTNITLHDDTGGTGVLINIYDSSADVVSFGPQSALTYSHNYTATIGTGVMDRGGNNGLSAPYTWSFTTAGSGIDSDPIINWGLSRDDQIGQRFSDDSTRVDLGLAAWDDITNPLTVTASTSGHAPWYLTGSGYYSYKSAGNESLLAGPHTVTFTIQDGAANTVTFHRDIYIFTASPILSLPANGATGVSTTPTFTWSYSGSPRPMYYNVAVFDGPDMNTAPMVWLGYMADLGSGTHSITIPADKQLATNKTYYWGVRGANREENGETFAGLWPFTTGGTPPPAPRFIWAWVRSDDVYPPALQGNLVAKVAGPSPADIVQLKVTGPGGFQYIFTEDDIWRSEQLGQYYMRNFPNPLSNGTYTFSVTDSAGRIVTATKDFTSASVPRVDYTTMVPADNTYVNTTTPLLSWGSVPGGYYYRVFIWDWNGNESPVYASPYIQDTSITIPSGVLFPNTPYNWRVDVFDAPYGSNRSRSNALRFSTGSSGYIPANMIQWVNFYSDNNYYGGLGRSISVDVLGPLPNEVTSFNVSGPGLNYDFLQNNIMYNLAWPQGSMYTIWQPGALAGGDYTLNLQTPLGIDTYPKNLALSTIPIVDQASMSPANNAYLTNLTPTFSWTSVGSYYYRVLIMDWRNRFVIYVSTRTLNLLSLTMPPGILKPNRYYMWRVEVYDESTGDADNRSTSGWNCFTTPGRSLTDFDGDGKTDITVYRASAGAWYVIPSGGGTPYGVGWGGDASDKPVPGDYDGDGKTDIAVYRAATGAWYVIPSGGGTPYGVGWGGDASDKPVPGDYDGDGKTDIAVYRAATGAWYVIPSGGGTPYGVGWGGDASDKPVPGDYDGDGKTDIAVYRAGTGAWYVIPSGGGTPYGVGWGGDASDKPVPGDYDGDGKTDIAVYRASTGAWYVIPSGGGTPYGIGWGGDPSDKPAPGDYDGDGKTDIAVYRSGTGAWYVYPSGGASPYGMGWGGEVSDIPVTMNLSSID